MKSVKLDKHAAVIFIGMQKEYFDEVGVLYNLQYSHDNLQRIRANAIRLLNRLVGTGLLTVAAPTRFTENYQELRNPVGVLKSIRDNLAFNEASPGSEHIDEFSGIIAADSGVVEIPGKRGLNAFSNTELESMLNQHDIHDVYLAGALTSLCIDSTARYAYDAGFNVFIVGDCLLSGSEVEHDIYLNTIFPGYARMVSTDELILSLPEPSNT